MKEEPLLAPFGSILGGPSFHPQPPHVSSHSGRGTPNIWYAMHTIPRTIVYVPTMKYATRRPNEDTGDVCVPMTLANEARTDF